MSSNLEKQAEALAAQPYSVAITRDEAPDEESAYVVYCPELPGCMTHGATVEEALENLKDARKQYILSLLEDGLPVPPPAIAATETTVYTSTTTSSFLIATVTTPPRYSQIDKPEVASVMDDFVTAEQAKPTP